MVGRESREEEGEARASEKNRRCWARAWASQLCETRRENWAKASRDWPEGDHHTDTTRDWPPSLAFALRPDRQAETHAVAKTFFWLFCKDRLAWLSGLSILNSLVGTGPVAEPASKRIGRIIHSTRPKRGGWTRRLSRGRHRFLLV